MKTSSLISAAINENGHIIQPIVGKSMWPLLRNRRDSVHVVQYNHELKKGDIVLFIRKNEKAGHHVLHRIMRKHGDTYIICGDNCYTEERVTDDMIVGVADGIYRDEKFISVDDRRYKVYLFFCMLLYPVRKPIIRLRELCKRGLGKLKRCILNK